MPSVQSLTRRRFASAGLPALCGLRARAANKSPRILLRSSWQSVNIGDIGHTPGALAVLYRHLPDAEITLWPGQLGHGSRELLTKAFPSLRIVEGGIDADGKPTTEAIAKAWAEADLYLSGSGSGFPAAEHAVAFRKATNKPVGVFGVSADPISGIGKGLEPEGGTLRELRAKALELPPTHLAPMLRFIIDRAAFFFCRDTISRDYLIAQKVRTPVLAFGPDAQLGMTLRDDPKASEWLKKYALQTRNFICVIPRLRYTPYYSIYNRPRTAADDVRDAINKRTAERDHAKLRDLMVRYVRTTGNKVMTCPEMTYQMSLAKEVLVDPLPADVKRNVVWRDTYWLPDEAASVYARAEAVVSVECHSPLIALRNGTPAFYVRQPTDTCKGQMYHDFGASEWVFEVDETSGDELWDRLAAIHRDPAAARARVDSIMRTVEKHQERMADSVRGAIPV